MQIEHPVKPPHVVTDWELLLISRDSTIVTVDAEAGDTVQRTTESIIFRLVEKPSPLDPEVKLAATEVEFIKANILCIQRKSRRIQELTPEQKMEWRQQLQRFAGVKPPTPVAST